MRVSSANCTVNGTRFSVTNGRDPNPEPLMVIVRLGGSGTAPETTIAGCAAADEAPMAPARITIAARRDVIEVSRAG